MTIQDLGSLGELIAALATIATLIYLALQIRQNTTATRAASFHAVTDARNQVNFSITQDPGMARIFLEGSADRGSLCPEDRLRFDFTCLSYLHVVETMHYQASVGAGERVLVEAEGRSLSDLFALPGVREWWVENPYAFGQEFRSYIDGFVDESPESPKGTPTA